MNNLLDAFHLTALPAAAEAFRADVKHFLDEHLPAAPDDVRARSWMGFDAEFSRRLAARGWIGLTLPASYGGAGMDAFRRFVLVEELAAMVAWLASSTARLTAAGGV